MYVVACLLFSQFLDGRIYVLGYPKSGNNLLCYSLANILDRAVFFGDTKIYFLPNTLGDLTYFEKIKDANWNKQKMNETRNRAIIFNHAPAWVHLNEAKPSQDYLIVIVRDYHECITKHVAFKNQKNESFDAETILKWFRNIPNFVAPENCFESDKVHYMNILRCYDKWNPQKRVLVYYEDLLTDFESTMRECIEKLHVPHPHLEEFLLQKEERLEECRESYRWGETASNGDLKFHQEKWLTPEIAVEIDAILERKFPYFCRTYLKRYKISQ